jgi:hypothetical protein
MPISLGMKMVLYVTDRNDENILARCLLDIDVTSSKVQGTKP